MLNSYFIKCRLDSVVLISEISEVDGPASSVLLPGGSGGTPLLGGFTASCLAHVKLVALHTTGDIFSRPCSVAPGKPVWVCWHSASVQT